MDTPAEMPSGSSATTAPASKEAAVRQGLSEIAVSAAMGTTASPFGDELPKCEAVENVIVAIHGIGDQICNDTILSTAIRFCERYGYPGLISLGAFQSATSETPGLMIFEPPRIAGFWGKMAFAEAHWADIARRVQQEGYTLQETKGWARTIVNRLRVVALRRDQANAAIDYRRIRYVIEEIIEAIDVIQTLLFLVKKAGLGDFNLKEVLDNYLGDVQLVTEFAAIRAEIIARFTKTMANVATQFPHANLHVVAHSEGTVVSFLALLEACDHPDAHNWIHRVRGFMTLGSPIDKHLILWPGLFRQHRGPGEVAGRIRWVNYTDYGDPVGFTLDTARRWLAERGYAKVFHFDPKDDFCFNRYVVPGKAHLDYWHDPVVFGDFIQRVVHPAILERKHDPERVDGPPCSKKWIPMLTYGIGYALPFALVHVAAYVLVNAIGDYYDPKEVDAHPNFTWTVFALAWLLAGTTVWLRLIRLTRSHAWLVRGLLIYAVSVAGYIWAFSQMEMSDSLYEFTWLERVALVSGLPEGMTSLVGSLLTVVIVLARSPQWSGHTDYTSSTSPPIDPPSSEPRQEGDTPQPPPRRRLRSGRGQKRMIWMTGAGMLGLAAFNHFTVPGTGSLLGLVIAIAIFLYTWWLSSLLFDLVFIWHRYVRADVAMKFLRTKVAPTNFQAPERETPDPLPNQPIPPSTP